MKILIVGAGFGGLALAAYLRRDGHHVTLIERRAGPLRSGFVMGIWRNGLRTLEPFGIVDEIQKLGRPVIEEQIREKTGKLLATMDYRPLIEKYGSVFLLQHMDLYKLLQGVVSEIPIQYGTQINSWQQEQAGVDVTLGNGQRAVYDLVVGADGLHSRVRKALFGTGMLTYSGVRIWFSMLPAGVVELSEPNNLYGEGEYICLLPAREGRVGALFLASLPETEPDLPQERIAMLRKRYDDFDWMIPDVLRSLEDAGGIASYNIEQVSLENWYRGRVVLLGDAAHAVSPTTTMGCSMAFEDAHVLTEELREAGEGQVEVALERYVERRKQRLEQIRRTSDFLLWWTGMKQHGMVMLRNMGMHLAPPAVLLRDMREIIDAHNDV